MNYPGPINSSLSSASAVSLEGDQFTFNSQSATGQNSANGIVIPDKHLLFHGDYARAGNDLILSAQDQKYIVHDYFKGEKRPALISEDGAMLPGHVVSSLTGHVQYAQATPPDAAQVIGHVMKLTGSASVIRNGVTIELNIGDAVQKGDVVQTGSDTTIAMTLIDGSAFGMTSNARMILNEMVYDPNGSSNSAFISLVQGTVTFVAGQTAKNGNMRVETPVATMGIRGTAVLVKIIAETGNVETSLGVEPDGHVGGLVFYDNTTGALIGTMTQAGRVTVFSPSGQGQPVTASEYQKSPDQTLSDKSLFSQVFQLYFPNFNPDDSKPKSTDRPRTDIAVPPTIVGKNGTDADTGRPTLTYVIHVTDPNTQKTTDLKIIYTNSPAAFLVTDVADVQATVLGQHQFKLGDRVTITDPDIGVGPFFDVAIPYLTGTGLLLPQATGPSFIPNSFLMNTNLVSLDAATGIVTYNPEGFRFLGAGETAVYTFTFVSASGPDRGNETLHLTVTGENDAPVFVSTDTPVPLGEDAALQVTKLLDFKDQDFSDIASSFNLQSSLVTTVNGTAGSNVPALTAKLPSASTLAGYLTIDPLTGVTRTPLTADGQVTAKFAAPDNTFDFLGEGESITLTYTVGISDGHLVEVTPGNFQQVFAQQTVTVTITGANDAPVLNIDIGSHSIAETTGAQNIASVLTLSLQGNLVFTDIDIDDAHTTASPTSTTSVAWTNLAGTATTGTVPPLTLTALNSALSTSIANDSKLDATGHLQWNFALADGLADFLAEGEKLTIQYTVNVNDTKTGGNVTQPVTIFITGTNDAPVAHADDEQGVIVEAGNNVDGTVFAGTPNTSGNVLTNDTDIDTNDTHTIVGVAAGNTTPVLNVGIGATIHGTYGDLLLGAGGGWTYALDNTRLATNALAAGVHVNDVFSYTESDNQNATSTTTLTIGVTGTNDAPVTNNAPVAATDLNTGPAVTEGGVSPGNSPFTGVGTATGNVLANDTDVDAGDTQTVEGVAAGSPSGVQTGHVGIAVAGMYGSVTIDAQGNWSYALDNNNPATDALKQGESAQDVFTYTMHDAAGVTSSATVTINITGTNDAPVISSAPEAALGSVIEDTTLTATGQLAATDVDHLPTQSWAIFDSVHGTMVSTLSGTYGSLSVDSGTGEWTYTLANGIDGTANPVQSLAAGEQHDETFSVVVTDDQGATATKTVTVTVNGTNDAPVAVADTITEYAAPTDAGWFFDSDNGHYYRYIADAGVTWAAAGTAAAADGGYLATITSAEENSFIRSLIPLGENYYAWLGGYGPTATNPASWYWTSGPEQESHFTYTNWNPNTDNVNASPEPNGDDNYADAGLQINPDGTWNDVPTTSTDHFRPYGYVEEWGGQVGPVSFREDTDTTLTTQQLLANDTDVDTPHASLSITGVSDGTHGTVSLAGSSITYHPDTNYNGADSFTYTLSDGTLTSTGTVSFNVTAVNDAPTINTPEDFSTAVQSSESGGSWLAVSGTPFGDIDANGGEMLLKASVEHGVLGFANSAPGVTIDPNHDGSDGTFWAIGTLSALNAAISDPFNLSYSPVDNYSGIDHLTLVLDDQGYSGSGGAQFATVMRPIDVYPDADYPVFVHGATASGNEDTPISLGTITLAVNDTDGSEQISGLVLIGYPAGTTFSVGYDDGYGAWVIDDAIQLAGLASTALMMSPPSNYNGSFQLNLSGNVADSATLTDGRVTSNGGFTEFMVVTVNPVNDAPLIDLDTDSSGTGVTRTYVEGTNIIIAPDSIFGDIDTAYLAGGKLTVNVTSNPSPTDSISIRLDSTVSAEAGGVLYNGVHFGIDAVNNGSPGHSLMITFGNAATPADVQAIIQHITFSLPSDNNPSTLTREVTFTVTDGQGGTSTAVASIAVESVNDAPVITSNGGGATASISIVENTTGVTTVQATDVDGPSLTYQLVTGTGSPDAAKFAINASTGVLTFVAAPDFEAPTDSDANNTYVVQVRAWDGTDADVQTLTVAVTNVAETIQTNEDTPTSDLATALNSNAALTIVSVANAQHGTIALNNGHPVFTPDKNFSGQASFTYLVSDAVSPPAPGTFQSTVNYAAGTYPQAVTIADVNGDGKLDLLTSNYTVNAISVMLGNGNGTFQTPVTIGAGTNPATQVVVADFNNDGKMDFAVGNYGSDNVSIGLGTGNGTSFSVVNYDVGDGPEGLVAGDVNGDGKIDLVVSNYNAGSISVLIGNGNGGFTHVANYYYVGNLPYQAALADLNGDGNLDIVASNAGSNYISVLLGNGNGTFQTRVDYATPAGSNDVAIGDLNGDGKLDIVSSNGTVSVFLGNGNGSFQAQTSYAANIRTKGISLVDFNQDGKLDVVVANSRDGSAPNSQINTVSVLLGDGTGALGTPTAYSTGSDTYDVAVADLNGDGRMDIVAPNELSDNVSVILGTAPGGTLSKATVTVDVAPVADAPTLAIGALTPVASTSEFRVNTATANAQHDSAIANLASGGFVVTWVSDAQDGSGSGIYGQRYDSSGHTVGSEFRVNTTTAGNQLVSSVDGLTSGGFVVSWSSEIGGFRHIFAQRYDTNGNASGSEFTVNTSSAYQDTSKVTALAGGGFVVTWASFQQDDGNSWGIYGQRYSSNGTAAGSEFLVNTTTADAQQHAMTTATADGGFIVTWSSYGQDAAGGSGVYFQRFNASGTKVGSETIANTTTAGSQNVPDVAALNDGTFIVAWQDQSTPAIFAQHFNSAGIKIGGEFRVGTTASADTDTTATSVLALVDGGYLVTWKTIDAGGDFGLMAQRYSSSDAAVGATFTVNQTTSGAQDSITDRAYPVTQLASGDLLFTWHGAPSVNGTEVYARVFSLPGIGAEDTAIVLPTFTAALGADSSEVLSLHLTGFPTGSTFSAGSLVGSEWVIPASAIAGLATTPLKITTAHGYTGAFTLHVDAVSTDTAVLSTGTVTDTAHSVAFDIGVTALVNNGPELIGDGISTQQVGPSSPNYGTITKVVDLALSDSDEGSALSTVSAVAGHGSVTYGAGNTSLASGVSGTVTDINAIFHNGVTYTPTSAPSASNTDKVTVTVIDSHGASDTINFIFQQANAPNAAQLTGTTGKDIIFATEHNETLFGDLGRDNFVFSSTTGQHVVTDFTQGQDRVDLHMTNAPTNNAGLGDWLNLNATQSGADTILYLDAGHTAQNQIVLQHVTLNNLTASDFIIHA